MKPLLIKLVLFCFLATSLNVFAAPGPPSVKQCRTKWTLTDVTPGLSFGDFTIESGSGTIALTGGAARSAGGTVDLVTAGSAVNSHQISITNTKDPVACLIYGVTIGWNTDPTATDMAGAGNPISMSNVLIDIPGETGTPFTVTDLPYSFVPPSVPFVIEITAQMDVASFPQLSGAYTSGAGSYDFFLSQSTKTYSGPGTADTFSITPLSLTAVAAMDFGQIASGSIGGTIVLNETSGVRSVASGDADIVSNAVVGTPGTFTIVGDVGLTFAVSYINGSLTDAAGANAMTLSGFTDTTTGLVLTGAADAFSVGASLTMSGSQPSGSYSTANPGGAPYSITVNYN